MSFEFVEWKDVEEDRRPKWDELDEYQQYWMLKEAYEEKAFRMCGKHMWELSIEYGHIHVHCIRCSSSYGHINPDYQDDLVFNTILHSLEWKVEKDSFSDEIKDQYLEAM